MINFENVNSQEYENYRLKKYTHYTNKVIEYKIIISKLEKDGKYTEDKKEKLKFFEAMKIYYMGYEECQ
ncbi:hypothetical protein [Burkholderia multivorans]|uniref:hypothetical protein n=1 Tax=Burkholderia multivorans TaxID=87883 RepID=UPI001C263AC6|nr:hypothetical protein [Burkholderia multivorans]